MSRDAAGETSETLTLDLRRSFGNNKALSLAVVENLRGKSKGEFVYSFSESVHPIVPQKKNPHELGLGNFFHSTLNFRLKLGSKIL